MYRALTTSALVLGCLMPAAAWAVDEDALSLPGEPPPAESSASSPIRLLLEAAVGQVEPRNGARDDAHRAAIDLRASGRFGGAWQYTLSDRLDDIHPVLGGQRTTRNSLREASIGWAGEQTSVDIGRINLRNGPAYGFNPTDYFRSGALRTFTTADPVALRENRLGTYMLRVQQLLPSGSLTLALAPKLDDEPSEQVFSFDAGSTNNRDRALLVYSAKASDRLSGQLLLLGQRGKGAELGLNASGLVSDAVVVHGEWSMGRERSLYSQLTGSTEDKTRRHRLAIGSTVSFPSQTSVTLEFEGNSAGLDANEWNALVRRGPEALQRYLAATQASLELGSRRAWLLYATQKALFSKRFDVTGFVRWNGHDHSRLIWAEGRYRWDKADLAVQWQRSTGRAGSEFGLAPYRQVIQLVADWYF